MTKSLADISAAGTSIWLDDLSRERMVKNGKARSLTDLIANEYVVGVTTNPAIFSASISGSDLYRDEISALSNSGADVEAIITALTTSDVRKACDLFMPVYQGSNGVDGRVSIEVDPRFARDTSSTLAQARELWRIVDRPNVLIKVPATVEGLPAIRTLISEGISVNVTIIFSVARYQEVLESFITGLEDRRTTGMSLDGIHSVASFFISRVDTEVDPRLKASGNDELLGRAAIANARLAYKHFLSVKDSPRWKQLETSGAYIQRPLWASTGVKDPNYSPTKYVVELVAAQTVNTMPEATLSAVRDSLSGASDSITPFFSDAQNTIEKLAALGIDMDEVAVKLENEGIDKFIKPWLQLIEIVNQAK